MMLCGDGVQFCHGAVEAHDAEVRRQLAEYLWRWRPDTTAYIEERFGNAHEWLRRVYGLS